jgi:hypothetical protein
MQNDLSNMLIDPTRRGFIRQASVMSLGALAAVSLAHANPAAAETMKSGMSKSDHGDIAVLNTALALEYQAIAAIRSALKAICCKNPCLP